MAITNLYSNLPGHLVEFKDGGLQLRESSATPTTKSILIIGTAIDGPVNEPVAIDISTVSKLFGPDADANGSSNGTTLVKYAKQAYKCGFDDIRCMRVTGSVASAQIVKANVVDEVDKNDITNAVAKGNAVSTFNLSGVPLGDVKLVVGGVVTSTTIPNVAQAVTVPVDTRNSGEAVGFSYTVSVPEKTAEKTQTIPYVDGTTVYTLDFPVKAGTLNATVGGTSIAATATGTQLTVTEALVAGDEMIVAYTTITAAATTQVVEEGGFVLSPQTQTVAIGHAGTVSVTIGGAAFTAFTVTGGTNVNINLNDVTAGSAIVITSAYTETATIQKVIDLASRYGGETYNEGKVSVANGTGEMLITLTKPASKKYTVSEAPMVFSTKDYATFGALVSAINNHPLNNVFVATAEDEEEALVSLTVDNKAFTGGTNGILPANNAMYEALVGVRDENGYLTTQGAFQILENYNVDGIYIAGVYANSKLTGKYAKKSFHYELALACAVLTYRTKMTHGYIDWKPNTNTTLVGIQNFVAEVKAYDNIHFMVDDTGSEIVDENGEKFDLGWYTSLVVGPEVMCVSDTLGNYYGSPAIAYAALNAKLNPQSAPTNKAISGVKGIRYKLSNKQMDDITANRGVVFKVKNEGTTSASSTPYVVDGCTCGKPGSDYARLTTVRVVTEVVDQLREVADPFIGEPNTIEQRNALAALISKRLAYLKSQGVIQYYEFDISATIEQVLLGECKLSLTLVAPQELRKITTVVALKATA